MRRLSGLPRDGLRVGPLGCHSFWGDVERCAEGDRSRPGLCGDRVGERPRAEKDMMDKSEPKSIEGLRYVRTEVLNGSNGLAVDHNYIIEHG